MFDDYFWREFWPQFFGGLASGVTLGILTLIIGYVARLKIAKSVKRVIERIESAE